MNRCYLGLANTFHDSAIAVVNGSGEVVFAEATERHVQSKRAVNMMPDAFARTGEILSQYCAGADEIVPALSWSQDYRQALPDQLRSIERSKEQLRLAYGEVPEFLRRRLDTATYVIRSQQRSMMHPGFGLECDWSQLEGNKARLLPLRCFDHHLTHAAAACFSSPYEDAVCAIVDGFGENRALGCYAYEDGTLRELELPLGDYLARDGSSVSLGNFYEDVCDACGFGFMKGEEWKVMGLAAYGEHDAGIRSLLRQMIRADGLRLDGDSTFGLMQARYRLHERRRKPGEPPLAARDLAYAGQAVFTEVLVQLLNSLHALGISNNLALGGGCALNSSANGQILERTAFKNLHVFSAPADDGNAVGAALLAYQQDQPRRRPARLQSPYLGSSMCAEALDRVRRFSGLNNMHECGDGAPERAAELLSQGRIVGWIQGRAEFGPRALGNRSILADPRDPAIKETINARVKFREEFRPFAPSILEEFGAEYFENYQVSPYMERTLRFRSEVQSRVPGAVHHDGTGRLQTVRREWNEKYWRLIHRFHALTGIPLVINTSFNVMGKPIAHSVEDALAVFHTSGLDALFIEDLLILK